MLEWEKDWDGNKKKRRRGEREDDKNNYNDNCKEKWINNNISLKREDK